MAQHQTEPARTAQSPAAQSSAAQSRTAGSQTLARGLEVLRAVAATPDGMTVADVAAHAGTHRTVAYRLLNTLVDARLIHRGQDGRYRGAAGLLSLSSAAHSSLAAAARPLLRGLADQLGATVSLIIREGEEAVALAVISPADGAYHVTFAEGSTHPLTVGAAGHALLASAPGAPGDPESVVRVRRDGFAATYGEVEPNMYGLAVPLDPAVSGVPACLNVISARSDLRETAVPLLRSAAQRIAGQLV